MARIRMAALGVALALMGSAAQAGPREKLLVDDAWLAGRLGSADLVILQVGDKTGYEAGHIPGARLVMLTDLAAPMGGDALTLELPDPAVLHDRLEKLGVSDRARIVVVPSKEGIQSATRVVFTLEAAGLGDRTVLLNGGTAAWAAAGRPLSKDASPSATAKLAPLKMRPVVVDAAFVRSHSHAPGYVVVDARAPEFYAGERPGGSPTRPHKLGHIAGAKSVPFAQVTTPDLKLASPEEIAARFRAAGVKRGDTVIAYCHVGQQASATLFAARTLGLNALLYDGSFEEWSRQNGEVETGR